MSTLLQIVATPHQNGNSQTRHLADSFLDAWLTVHPSGVVETLDLSTLELPAARRADGRRSSSTSRPPPPEQLAARRRALDRLVAQFTSADAYLFVTPMWNFGLPHTLKHYFDLVIRPGWTFNIGAEGPVGLLEGRTAYAVVTRGFDYGPDSPHPEFNHLEPHLRTLLGFMGIHGPVGGGGGRDDAAGRRGAPDGGHARGHGDGVGAGRRLTAARCGREAAGQRGKEAGRPCRQRHRRRGFSRELRAGSVTSSPFPPSAQTPHSPPPARSAARPASPTPPGGSALGTMCTSTTGASGIRIISIVEEVALLHPPLGRW